MSAIMPGSARYSANAASVICVSAPSASANRSRSKPLSASAASSSSRSRVYRPHDGGVYIQEVAWQSTAEQGADLVGDSVIGVQDRADGKLNGIMGAPVDGQLDLLLGTASGARQGQPGERLGAHDHRHLVASAFKRGDDRGCQLGELAAVLPAGKQVHITARPITHSVSRDRVPAGQREPVPRACREGDPRYLLVPWLHRQPLTRSR